MEPLICPQCGGQITDYVEGRTFATCGYCSTRFLIEQNRESVVSPPPVYEPLETTRFRPQVFVSVIGGVFAVIAFFVFVALVSSKRTPTVGSTFYGTPRPSATTPALKSSPNPNLLEFGGKGTGSGLFQDANSIAVDRQGRIYVSDDSLRVQQFDEKGQYLKTVQVPANTGNYDHARTIDKIAVGQDNTLYVAVGGVIQVYPENAVKLSRVIEMAPDYIQDFALKSDGGMVIIYDDDRVETLIVVTKTGTITKRVTGFHTKALDAAISPQETAISAIRLAVDGAGNIFSVYAFGDLGSYSISSNNDELMIARFTPEGKYVNKFAQSISSCGIEVDNQSRIYVTEGDSISIYSNTGQLLNSVPGLSGANAFALDKDNNIYVLTQDKVVKRPAIP